MSIMKKILKMIQMLKISTGFKCSAIAEHLKPVDIFNIWIIFRIFFIILIIFIVIFITIILIINSIIFDTLMVLKFLFMLFRTFLGSTDPLTTGTNTSIALYYSLSPIFVLPLI